MKTGLALSGGGFRATVFHMGVLARLAESGILEETTFLSTVSGGSLCAGLIFTLNGLRWPDSQEYQARVLPEARRLITTVDLQRALFRRSIFSPWTIFGTRADDLSALLEKHWGVTARLSDLPRQPRWLINATCYETGKNWRFERFRMGDYLFGYSRDTRQVPVSDAMAASAGFPGLVGPLVLDTRRMQWFRYRENLPILAAPEEHEGNITEPIQPVFPSVHLWDGGVYDNHGLEGLHDFTSGWRDRVDFLIVSDGAGRPKPDRYRPGIPALFRIINSIMMDQVRSLRARAVIERMVNHQDPGVFLQTGNTRQSVYASAGKASDPSLASADDLSQEEANRAANMPTVIRRLTGEEFQRLFRHGFEVADCTLYAYYPDQFPVVSFAKSSFGRQIMTI